MSKTHLVAFAVLSMGIAHAQQPDDARPPLFVPRIGFADPLAFSPPQQVVNLGDVVVNVVIAKVLGEGADAELTIAKFGGKESAPAPKVITKMLTEQRQRKVIINGESIVQDYTVQIPVMETTTGIKENFTPTEKDRSVPISKVKAFDLKGNPLNNDEWTKRLATPNHVLLLREPINDKNKLNSFYSAILREDILLLFLQGETVDERLNTVSYNVKDLPVWSKDGEAKDPSEFVDLIKSKVTPRAWSEKSSIRPWEANQFLVVTANQKTHEELAAFLKDMRDEIAKAAK